MPLGFFMNFKSTHETKDKRTFTSNVHFTACNTQFFTQKIKSMQQRHHKKALIAQIKQIENDIDTLNQKIGCTKVTPKQELE